jgi:hypothetical protein
VPLEEENAMASECGVRLPFVLGWLMTVLVLSGCGGHAGHGGASSASAAAEPDASSAWAVVKVITDAGLAVPNPHDVTAQRCPEIRCAGAVAADTVSIFIFFRSRDAQLYEASGPNGFQIGVVVLEFAPTVDAAQRAAYQRVVVRAVG